ncbi:hypothetical protein LNP25_26725 [Klebsiella variicola subsp. variicola]|nr:hypothetical protein [Klebsiella variicola subsp. variicola]
MQDPDAATEEMTRCFVDLGFVGALVNGFSQHESEDTALYLDDGRYDAFWEVFAPSSALLSPPT